jgi:hypothetical protein
LSGTPMHAIIYYVLIRLLHPAVILETGVCDGFSSRFILLAMERNSHGVLHSIDLPNQDVDLEGGGRQRDVLPLERQTGWLIPNRLRARWQLHLGNAKELLPQVLQELGKIDIFIHDSLHTDDHMLLEYRTAWPYLRPGGLLLSDDTDWNTAFGDFASEHGCPTVLFNFRIGAIRKPSDELGN